MVCFLKVFFYYFFNEFLYFLEFPSKIFFVFYDFFIDILYTMSG